MGRTRNHCWRAGVLAAAAVLWAATGFATQWLRTAVDPTCAVIESAEYDASRRSIRVTGRSTEAVTLRVYERETSDTLVVAEHAETGKWTVDFDIVGSDTVPGMVVVQGISGCATFRLVTDDAFGQLRRDDGGTSLAALAGSPAGARSGTTHR